MKLATLMILSALLLPNVAQAQSAPESIRITGEITAAYIRSESLEGNYALGSIDIFTPDNQSLGFSLGIDTVRHVSAAVFESVAFYPTVSYGFGNGGRLSFGIPRSATDRDERLLPDIAFAYSRLMDYTLPPAELTQPFVTNAYLHSSVNNIYGLRYDGDAGALSYAFSYHRLAPGGSWRSVYALALGRSFTGPGSLPEARAYLAIEHIDFGSSATRYMIGAEAAGERLAGGVNYVHLNSATDVSAIETWADYTFSDSFSSRLSLLHMAASTKRTYYGIGLKYTPRKNISLHASMLDSDVPATDPVWELGLIWEF